ETLHLRRFLGERPEGIVARTEALGLRNLAREPGRVRERVRERNPVLQKRRVEVEQALVRQPNSQRRGEGLGDRGGPKARVGLGVAPVVHPVRTAVFAGCRTVILTNACGAVSPGYKVGRPVLVSDHISLTGVSPLTGAAFVDLSDLYSKRIRGLARAVDPSLL